MRELEADTLTPQQRLCTNTISSGKQFLSAGVALSCAHPEQKQHRWKKAIIKAQEGTLSA